MNKKKSKYDYYFDRALTNDEVKEVEAAVNKTTSANLYLTEEIVSLEEAERNFNLTRHQNRVETVSIVHIGDYDS